MYKNLKQTSWIENIELKDVLDIKLLQKFQDDFAVPIVICGKHLGGIYGGQVASETLNESLIRKLSGKSKKTVDDIVKTNSDIEKSIINTQVMSTATLNLTEQQTASIQEVAATLQEVKELAESLDNIRL